MLILSRKRKKCDPYIIPNQVIDLLKINVTEKHEINVYLILVWGRDFQIF